MIKWWGPLAGAAVLALGALGACGAGKTPEPRLSEVCAAGVVRIEGGLAACGRMEPAFVKRLEDALQPGDTRLQLTSLGGEGPAAMALADLIQERGLKLEIAGICLSACAHFVYAPTPDAVVLQGALIGFHHTASYIRALPFADRTPESIALGRDLADQEAAFYRRRGLPISFLYQPGLLLTGCMKPDRRMTLNWMDYITPRRDKMEVIMGRPVRGFWPHDSKELGAAHRAVAEELSLPSEVVWAVGGLTPAPLDELEAAIDKIPTCTPEQLAAVG